MCEVMGMSLKVASRPERYLKEFLCRGDNYRFGWGIGLYPDNSAQVIKESTPASRLSWDRFLKYGRELSSKIFLGQLRNSTIGPRSRENNHPFHRELCGKEYVFVHNGTVYSYSDLETGQYKPIGKTDSEYIFCHLLHSIEKMEINSWDVKDLYWLASKLRSLNEMGTLNCIFSDGEYLFAYKSIKKERDLYFKAIHPDQTITLDDYWSGGRGKETTTLDRFCPEIKKLQHIKTGMIISTSPLTGQSWYQLKPGELMALQDGNVIFSNFTDHQGLVNGGE